jgi:flavin reductase (DIM6/NTAB) family NADH-FMN oxidoreductase RutF
MPGKDGRGMTPDAADVTPARRDRMLRDVLGRYATGVTVITTTVRGMPVGLTVNSFTSLSLDPPLVLWCLHQESATGAAFITASHFAVNILAAGQSDLAIRFASPGDRFRDTAVHTGQHGLPLLDHTVATIICRRSQVLPGGDHVMLFGAILDYLASAGQPLLFLDGCYQTASPDLAAAERPPSFTRTGHDAAASRALPPSYASRTAQSKTMRAGSSS